MGDITIPGPLLTILATAGSIVISAIGGMFGIIMTINHARLTEMTEQRNSYRAMLKSSTKALEFQVSRLRKSEGKPELAIVPPSIAQHSSPPKPRQIAAADIADYEARIAVAYRELDIPIQLASEKG